jgi:hypothetical protein
LQTIVTRHRAVDNPHVVTVGPQRTGDGTDAEVFPGKRGGA